MGKTEACKIIVETEFKVEFYDVDLMGIVYHGNYLKYFEVARWALLEKIRYTYDDMAASGCSFPVTSVALKYLKPLRFNDRVRARAILEEYENCLKIRYELYNARTGEMTTKGQTTQMVFNVLKNESSFVCPRSLIEKAESLLASEAGR
ncbi:MAG: acyl-CoA thioesterase [Treponema sp.]|jgi:acyl-CoA thioester hydrolase|nr:acyl-CoA thioesterase [Treponema sp.]